MLVARSVALGTDDMAKLSCLLVTICVSIPTILSQCTIEKAEQFFKRSIYEFSVDLVTRIGEDTDYHFVSSALSPWALISAAALAADGTTLSEMQKVLRHHPHKCFNNKYLEIVKRVTSANDGIVLERSSVLFADDRMQVKDVFRRRVLRTGICDIQMLPFDNFNRAAATINDYVSKATRGSIDEIVTPNDLEGVYVVLIDALYFKGRWYEQFSPSDTEMSAFYDERGNQVGDVNLMFLSSTFNVSYMKQINAHVLDLPYGENNRFSMLIFLPFQRFTVSNVIDSLKRVNLGSILRKLTQYTPETVYVQIPRFKISSDLSNLKELLSDMGLNSMFDSNRAQFPYLSDYSLYVSNFIQKADIEVTEEGTTAVAVSEAEFQGRGLPAQFIANKPFLFMIVDKQTEVPLFTGAYSKPSVY